MSDPDFGHDGNTDGIHNLLDHLWIRHSCYTTLLSDVCRDPLERHNGTGTRFLGDPSLFGTTY